MSSEKSSNTGFRAKAQQNRIGRRLLPAVLIVVMALVVAFIAWDQEAHAAPHEARGAGVMESCAADASCDPRLHGDKLDVLNADEYDIIGVQPGPPEQVGGPGAANQQDHVEPVDFVAWSSTMTVGQSDIASIGYLGFVTGDWPDTGSIDNTVFRLDGVKYVITALYHPIVIGSPNHLFLHLDKPLAGDMTLRVGPDAFHASDADVLGSKRNIYHWYLEARLNWEDGEDLPVSLTIPEQRDSMQQALVRGPTRRNG